MKAKNHSVMVSIFIDHEASVSYPSPDRSEEGIQLPISISARLSWALLSIGIMHSDLTVILYKRATWHMPKANSIPVEPIHLTRIVMRLSSSNTKYRILLSHLDLHVHP